MGQPKARTLGGQVFLADMSALGTSGVYKFNHTNGTCVPVGCDANTIKNNMMGLAYGPSDPYGPQDWLFFWSFDVWEMSPGFFRVYYLSRERAAPNRYFNPSYRLDFPV